MKVTFRQSGGFAGLTKGYDCDTDSLSPDKANVLQSLVKQCELSQFEKKPTENARDVFSYEITIDTGEGVHQLSFDDMTVPEDAEPLLEYLQRQAKLRSLA